MTDDPVKTERQKMKRKRVYRLTEAEVRGMLAETVHAAFRKGSDHASSHQVWKAIHIMPDTEWGKAVDWMVWALFYAKKREVQR